MKKVLCLALVLLLAACGARETPPPESSSAPAPSGSSVPESISAAEPPEGEAVGEHPVVPIAVDPDEKLIAAVEGMIAQYNSGTVTVTENIPALPERFAFPDSLDWGSISIAVNEVTGGTQVTIPAEDGKQTATFVCYYFAQEGGATECGVNTVIFQ